MKMKRLATAALFSLACFSLLANEEMDGDAAHAELVKKDLYAVITLNGADCGAVVEYQKQADSDYIVTCSNGKRYRVAVTDDGSVKVAAPEKP